MAASFHFDHRIAFSPDRADEILRSIPAGPGVFALRGEHETDQPFLTRAADVRRRLRRLLAPPELSNENGQPVPSKRLNLRSRVHFIEWSSTGSEFESLLVLYRASRAAFGPEEARRRLRLHTPYFLRVTLQHTHPRVYTTNRLSRRALDETFGPFPSRAAAERYCDAVLDLFKLRRCHEDLEVSPNHPGCAYGEMKKCLEPCKAACTPEAYAAEAAAVRAFFATRGESMLSIIAAEREQASERMDFERAAELHKQHEKVKAAASLADEIVRPVAKLRAVVVQQAGKQTNQQASESASQQVSAETSQHSEEGELDAAIFLFADGRICGPERLSTLGVRAVREQTAVGSSLFAQPLMLAAVPLDQPGSPVSEPPNQQSGETPESRETPGAPGPDFRTRAATNLSPEDRARAVLAHLQQQTTANGEPDLSERCDSLALFRRWYYRPEKQRAGEVFLPNADHDWPIRRILNGASRTVVGTPRELPPVDRDAAREKYAGLKTKIIHEGREGVERVVPVLPRRSRKKSVTPKDLA